MQKRLQVPVHTATLPVARPGRFQPVAAAVYMARSLSSDPGIPQPSKKRPRKRRRRRLLAGRSARVPAPTPLSPATAPVRRALRVLVISLGYRLFRYTENTHIITQIPILCLVSPSRNLGISVVFWHVDSHFFSHFFCKIILSW